jgi:hypothetical protein
MVDGYALEPSVFGLRDDDGIFTPFAEPDVDLSGAGSFHLDFADSDDLGKDASGNGNHFTAFRVQSGDTVDALHSHLD